MRGMILAAGRGQRMGELTAATPKPLLRARGQYLIEYSIQALVAAGIHEIVINVSYLREQIKEALGDGSRYGATIYYSEEPEALETGGGIFQALPLLGDEPFVVLSSDVVSEYPLQQLLQRPLALAHLVLVDNPDYHPRGDFGLRENCIDLTAKPRLTFGNIGIYRPELFDGCSAGHFRLGDLLKSATAERAVTGEHYAGVWHNIGRPEDLSRFEGCFSEGFLVTK